MRLRRRLTGTAARWLSRQETRVDAGSNLKAGLGAFIGMLLVTQLATLTELPLLIAPLGATAVLLFGQPSSPLSQPVNVMLGYLVGTIVCEAAARLSPGDAMAVAVGVGAAIIVMRAMRVTHPPAGAMPILGFGSTHHGVELFASVLVGSVALIALAAVVHAIPPRRTYPAPAEEPKPIPPPPRSPPA